MRSRTSAWRRRRLRCCRRGDRSGSDLKRMAAQEECEQRQ